MFCQRQQYMPYDQQILNKNSQTANVYIGNAQGIWLTNKFRNPKQFKVHDKPFAMQNVILEGQTQTADPEKEENIDYSSIQMETENLIFGNETQNKNQIIYNDDITPIRELPQQSINQKNSQSPIKMQVRPISENGYLLKDSEQLLPILLSIYSNKSNVQVPKMMGFDFICLIDNSSFTNDIKLKDIKRSLGLLYNFTQQKDRICLITYNILLQKLNQLKYLDQNEFQELLQLIQHTNIQSSNLNDAMNMAINIIHNRQYKGNQIYVFIFTSRFDNTEYNKQQLKITLNSTQDLFHIFSFGFSNHISFKDLDEIARIKLGQHIDVQDFQSLDYYFASIFSGSTILAAEKVIISIKTLTNIGLSNIRINKAYGDRWKLDEKRNQCTMLIPYCPQNMTYQYCIELIIPQCKTNYVSQKLDIISVDISYYNPLQKKEFKLQTYNQTIIIHQQQQQNNMALNKFVLEIYNEIVYRSAIKELEIQLFNQDQQVNITEKLQCTLDKWKFSILYEKIYRYLQNLLKL